ncbi:sulfurtransferase [Metaplanococcus flavidus]
MKVFIETLETDNYRWIDTRYELGNSEAGAALYKKEHIEGAIYWDLEKDMSDMSSEAGRHPMPSHEKLTGLIRASGLTSDDHIVVYDQGGAPFAARAWWLLKYCGFENVFISRMGFSDMKEKGAAVSQEIPELSPSNCVPEFNSDIYADREYVKNVIKGEELGILLDARSPERYAGTEEPLDRVAGRIPGAHNFDWSQLVHHGKLDTDVDFSSVIQPNEPVVVYCGSGVTAAPLYAMLAEKGYDSLRLYTGSYSDWITDPENEVEIDREQQPEVSDEDTRAILAKLIEEGYSGEMLMKKFEYEKSLLDEKKKTQE